MQAVMSEPQSAPEMLAEVLPRLTALLNISNWSSDRKRSWTYSFSGTALLMVQAGLPTCTIGFPSGALVAGANPTPETKGSPPVPVKPNSYHVLVVTAVALT